MHGFGEIWTVQLGESEHSKYSNVNGPRKCIGGQNGMKVDGLK